MNIRCCSILMIICMPLQLFCAQRSPHQQKETRVVFKPTNSAQTRPDKDKEELDRVLLANILSIAGSFGHTLLDPNNKVVVAGTVSTIISCIGTIASHLFKSPLTPEMQRRLDSPEFMELLTLNLIGEAHNMHKTVRKIASCTL